MHLNQLKSDLLFRICQKFGVKELYAFGSVAQGTFTDDSDLDFLVLFDRPTPNGSFEQFMGLKTNLEQLFNRPVDLLTLQPFRNPVFQDEVDKSKVLLYAA